MTGNVAQVFLTDEDWAGALGGIHAALRPRGYLVFETRRPDWRAWEKWAAEAGRRVVDIPGTGPVEQRSEVTGVSLPFVSIRGTYTSARTARSSSQIRLSGSAAATRRNRAWSARAIGCWM